MKRIRGDFDETDDVDRDRLSAPQPIERRAVHPYRDRREALLARRSALARELAEAERAAERRDRLAHRVAIIDDELRTLDETATEAPAETRWDVHHCARCDRDVPRPRRSDGHLLTADRGVARRSALARAARSVAVSVLVGASAMVVVAVATVPTITPRRGILDGARASIEAAPVELRPVEPAAAPAVDLDALRSAPPLEDEVERAPPITDEDLDRHIRWIAPQVWEIDRALVHRASVGSIAPRPRFIPHERDGRVVGVRVYGVRRASLLGRLGVRNGDTIVDVNGLPAEASSEGVALLRDADALFVRLERRGEEVVHVYRIAG